MNHRAFTLMELMIVIVIIGILSAVGMVMFGGQAEKAKKIVTESNYKSLIKLMKIQLVQCDINGYMELMSDQNSMTVKQHSCTLGTIQLTPYIINHMNNLNFKSPYDQNSQAIVCCGKPYSAGQTYVGVGGNDPNDASAIWWFRTKIDNDPNNVISGRLSR